METLYVVEPGSYVKKSGNALNIMKQGTVLETIPAAGLEKLVLSGYVSLSGPVMDFLIRKRVETVFVTPTGRFRARLMIDEHKHVALRKMIKPADFVFRNRTQKTFADEQEMKKQRPVEMKPYLYKTFLASYEDMMTGKALYRNLMRRQVRNFSEYLNKSEEKYQPIAM